jgi:hypothetical protein
MATTSAEKLGQVVVTVGNEEREGTDDGAAEVDHGGVGRDEDELGAGVAEGELDGEAGAEEAAEEDGSLGRQ